MTHLLNFAIIQVDERVQQMASGKQFNPVFLAMDVAVGAGIGAAMNNIGLGIGIGLALGAGLAAGIGTTTKGKKTEDSKGESGSTSDN